MSSTLGNHNKFKYSLSSLIRKNISPDFYKKLIAIYSYLRNRYRSECLFLVNVFATFIGLFLAAMLLFDNVNFRQFFGAEFVLSIVSLIFIRVLSYHWFGVDKNSWRFTSINEGVLLLKAHFFASMCFALIVFLVKPNFFPRSIFVLESLATYCVLISIRLSLRLMNESFQLAQNTPLQPTKSIVVLGAGTTGHYLLKAIKSQCSSIYKVEAVFDDSDYLWGEFVHGVPVRGPISFLGTYLEHNNNIATIIIAIPRLNVYKIKAVEETAKNFNIPVKIVRGFEEIAFRDFLEINPKQSIEEVLEKELVVQYPERIGQALFGKDVLITGAGGSIGSELVRQVLSYSPRKLICLDQSEFNLFSIQQEIDPPFVNEEDNSQKDNDVFATEKIFVLADIANKDRLNNIFATYQPQIVFHAAAYKHVPLVEVNTYEAFNTNVIGTRNLLELSSEYNTEKFVLISTDKAVDPTSVMGSTKRIAELMVEQFSEVYNSNLMTAAVRFGNVINSSGSVIPTFRKQILAGKPITVTHPDITRYFMSIKQAVQLVLTAGTLGKDGEIYLLDMGEPIKIVDVANKLKALYGRKDLPIQIVGLRKGEKLYEDLVSHSEVVSASEFKRINVVKSSASGKVNIFSWVSLLEPHANYVDNFLLGNFIRGFVLALAEESFDKIKSFFKTNELVKSLKNLDFAEILIIDNNQNEENSLVNAISKKGQAIIRNGHLDSVKIDFQ